jgi:triphosphatase
MKGGATAAPTEVEIKLRIPRSEIAHLFQHSAIKHAKSGRAARKKLVSTYFDTPNLRLAKSGIGVRLRRDGRRWIQTVKGPADADSGAGLSSRPEYEWTIGTSAKMPALDITRLATTPWRRVLLKSARDGLAPIFTTQFARTQISIALPAKTVAILAVDVGVIRTRQSTRRADISEIELELQSGDVAQVFRFAMKIADDVPLSLEPASKAMRGVRLFSGASPAPVHAENANLQKNAAAGEALTATLRSCLRQIEGNVDGLLNDDDPEWIHQMRIGTRRLRACLSLISHLAKSESLVHLINEVKWLATALGRARDLDVLAIDTLPALRSGTHGTTAESMRTIRSFAAKVALRRRQARSEAREAVGSRRFVAMMLAAGTIAAAADLGADREATETTTRTLARDFAARLLVRRQKKLFRRGEALPDAPPEARHGARIAAKKLRYATEFFADVFPGKRTRTYRKSLARLQDVLGILNDATVAARLAREIAGPDSNAAALLQGWAAAQAMVNLDDLAQAWRGFNRAKPFWN